MSDNFTDEEILALQTLVRKANKNDRIVGLLQPVDLQFNNNTKDGRRSFKKVLRSLEQKDCFDILHFQDNDKCIVDMIKISRDCFEEIVEINEEESNEQTNQ